MHDEPNGAPTRGDDSQSDVDRVAVATLRIPTRAEVDALVRELVEVEHYFDEQTGEWYEPDPSPARSDR